MARIGRAAGQVRALAEATCTARRTYGASPVPTLRRARRLRTEAGFTYDEALHTGLLDPAMPDARARRFVSKDAVTRLSDRLNPVALITLTEQKAIFYRVIGETGLPMPRLFGLVGRGGGWAGDGRPVPVGPAASAVFLASGPPEEFVVKPSGGYHGLGVRVLRRDGDELVDLAGARTTPAGLAEELCADPLWDVFVVQERLRNHPDLDTIVRSDTLQTLRVTTFVTDDCDVQVVHAGMKLALGGGNVDNFREGTTGNALVEVDVLTGELGTPMAPAPGGLGLAPARGEVAGTEGVRLPGWDEVLALARRAALELLPCRNIGWDISITTRGPVVVEANRSYDPWPSAVFGDVVREVDRAHRSGGRVAGRTA